MNMPHMADIISCCSRWITMPVLINLADLVRSAPHATLITDAMCETSGRALDGPRTTDSTHNGRDPGTWIA